MQVDYSDWEFLEKLNPEFRSKLAINSIEHHHFITISKMRRVWILLPQLAAGHMVTYIYTNTNVAYICVFNFVIEAKVLLDDSSQKSQRNGCVPSPNHYSQTIY